MLGAGGGERGGRKAVAAQERAWRRVRAAFCVLLLVLCILLISVVVVTVTAVVCCSVKLPLPDPPVLAFYFLFSSTPQWGVGRQSSHVALLLPNYNIHQL